MLQRLNRILLRESAVVLLAILCALVTAECPLNAQPICPGTTGVGNPSVLTSQNDNYRDAYNATETCLTSSAIQAGTVTIAEASFSPLLVDTPPSSTGLGTTNPIYAQPLYVAGITVHNPGQGTCSPCDMVVIATAYGSIYAYNADNGNLLWTRTGTGGTTGTNWLWYDDCHTGGAVVGGVTSTTWYVGPATPFGGIVSTPVIDSSPLSPYSQTMFVTSLCKTSAGLTQWWIHEIDIAGLTSGADVAGQDISAVQMNPSPSGTDEADDLTSGHIVLNPTNELQRTALLEVKNTGATYNPLIYVGFGSAKVENSSSTPYHGWLLGYTINSSSVIQSTPALAFAATPTGCSGGGGATQCSTGNGGTPTCDCLVPSGYQNAPNWGGHGGGIWMSGRGPAERTDSTGLSHTYVGVGNGGFQNSGATNWGESVLDFHLSSSGMPAQPSDSFTPHGGPPDCWLTNSCAPVIQLPLSTSSCAYGQTDGTCNYTMELLNENDWDMSVSGITLFDYPPSQHLAVTVDKAGFGYLLEQDDMGGFSAGDTGNLFPFQAIDTACTGAASSCHRVTSMAFYNNALYVWPYNEVLKRLQFNESGSLTGSSTIYTDSTGGIVYGSGFSTLLIPGDKLMADGCSGSSCPIVTAVVSNTQLTVSPPFSPVIPASGPISYNYTGYFVQPIRDTNPGAGTVGYPGGSLAITSNGTTSGTGVVWGLVGNEYDQENTKPANAAGYVDAYDAGTLAKVWSTYELSSFAVSYFALPTVVHATLFIPTWNITGSSSNSSCTATAPCLGVMVYEGSTN